MTETRASEIVREVFYKNFHYIPDFEHKEDVAFHFGRMLGIMQVTLEQELAKEVLKECD